MRPCAACSTPNLCRRRCKAKADASRRDRAQHPGEDAATRALRRWIAEEMLLAGGDEQRAREAMIEQIERRRARRRTKGPGRRFAELPDNMMIEGLRKPRPLARMTPLFWIAGSGANVERVSRDFSGLAIGAPGGPAPLAPGGGEIGPLAEKLRPRTR